MINVHDAVSPFAGSPISSPGGLIPDGMLPSGYTQRLIRDAIIVSHGGTMRHFEEMLLEHRTLHQWAAAHPDARPMQGRHTSYAVPLTGVDVSVVVRHSAHGGMLSPLTRDVFRSPRAPDELRLSWTLRHVGIPTPRVLGYGLYPTLHGNLWRADVVTREITDAADLAQVLASEDGPYDQERSIEATVTLLRRLARTWAYHVDLNVKNILIGPDERGDPMAYVLDVDTLRFAEKNAEWMNVARLVRSARKWLNKDGGPGFARLIERLGG
ncbi:MAG: lipopolysaccharide kinase InaA family protein [Gemmatimonadaceae bacterium]|nr:lipopolysaccharide kinase InaA family protein [Gemmatimonadaceae bacterium]